MHVKVDTVVKTLTRKGSVGEGSQLCCYKQNEEILEYSLQTLTSQHQYTLVDQLQWTQV
jgi:hypothetical protein